MTQGFLEIFSIEFYSEKWNQGGYWISNGN